MRFLDAYAILLLNEQKGEAYSYGAVYKDLGMAGAIMLDLFVAQKISILW